MCVCVCVYVCICVQIQLQRKEHIEYDWNLVIDASSHNRNSTRTHMHAGKTEGGRGHDTRMTDTSGRQMLILETRTLETRTHCFLQGIGGLKVANQTI
jgi:hypothetical protein